MEEVISYIYIFLVMIYNLIWRTKLSKWSRFKLDSFVLPQPWTEQSVKCFWEVNLSSPPTPSVQSSIACWDEVIYYALVMGLEQTTTAQNTISKQGVELLQGNWSFATSVGWDWGLVTLCMIDIFAVIVLVVSLDRPEYTTYHHQLKADQKSKMEI